MAEPETMSVKEFRARGYLAMINRKLLHPLGLALSVAIDDSTGDESFGPIIDSRDDPEGIIYDESMIDDEFRRKASALALEQLTRNSARYKLLGYIIQPTGDEDG